ncbi:hypothetical protein JJB98_03730 [Bradyrhizobium diazoefficiens]|nr:hypothetical protein [Bradyrhizobium diazoefficiens]QQO19084.1 hypothetical protein JJB98_03730 [Bradyrhizobium diazoefficiens]
MIAWETAAGPAERRQGSRCARPAPPACGLDSAVAEHIEQRLLQPKRLEECVTELKAVRDQACADAERAEGAWSSWAEHITPQALKTFASLARSRMRTETGGYRRDHLRALAQRV